MKDRIVYYTIKMRQQYPYHAISQKAVARKYSHAIGTRNFASMRDPTLNGIRTCVAEP